jgi:hypothetical protein
MAIVEGCAAEADDDEREENEDIFVTDFKSDVQQQNWCNRAWKRSPKENLESKLLAILSKCELRNSEHDTDDHHLLCFLCCRL